MSNKPNLFIIGVAKGGTTALANFLSEHPDVFMAEMKEPNFFSSETLEERELYYGKTYLKSEQTYLDLYKNGTQYKWKGEASVSYFQFPETAKKIKSFSPKAKLILLLRNPIQRAISHYLMDVRLGFVSVSLDEIIEKKEQYKSFYSQYIEQGLYYSRIQAFRKYFASNQLLILNGDKRDDIEMKSLEFLGINAITTKEVESNQGLVLKNDFLSKIYQSETIRRAVNKAIPLRLKTKLKASSLFKKQEYTLKSENQLFLEEYYHTDQQKVSELLSNLGGR